LKQQASVYILYLGEDTDIKQHALVWEMLPLLQVKKTNISNEII